MIRRVRLTPRVKPRLAFSGLLLLVALTGCSLFADGTPIEKPEPRIQAIDAKKIVVEPSQLQPVSLAQALQSYQRLLEKNDPDIRSEALRRIGDLTMRLSELRTLALADGLTESELPAELKQATYQKAILYYQQLLAEYPQYRARSEVEYQLAKAFNYSGNSERSQQVLSELVRASGAQAATTEAQFRRGEWLFMQGQYEQSKRAYAAVLDVGEQTEFFDQALYKHGWSQFKLNDYDYALTDFFRLLERLRAGRLRGADSGQLVDELLEDTYRTISLSFYHLDGPLSVSQYFEQHGEKPYEEKVYRSLAELYLKQQRYQDAAAALAQYIENHPLDAQAPVLQSEIIAIYQRGGFPSLVLPAKQKFVEDYGRRSEFWEKANAAKREVLLPQLKKHLIDLATHEHAMAQQAKEEQEKKEKFLLAAQWYGEYLVTFPQADDAAAKAYLKAEALYDAQEFDRAAQTFEQVAYDYPAHDKSNAAAYSALVSYQHLIEQADSEETRQDLFAQSIASTDRFARRYPDDERTPALLKRSVEQQLAMNDIEAAMSTAQHILTLPTLTQAQQAHAKAVIANGLFDLQRFSQAEQALTDALELSAAYSASEQQAFHERRAIAIYRQAEAAKIAGDRQQAVHHFLRIAQVEPDAKSRVNAEYDASVLLMELEEWQRAAQLLEAFQQRYSRHALSATVPAKLALIYTKLDDYARAAPLFEQLAQTETDLELKRDSIWQAAELYEKADQPLDAIRHYKLFANEHQHDAARAMEARRKLVDLYQQQGVLWKRDYWREAIITAFEKSDQTDPRARFLAAEASFALAEPKRLAFESIALRLPLKKTLAKKRKAMQEATAAYEKVAQYKVAQFTTAATFYLGDIYARLAKDLMASQRPSGLNEEELEEYGYLLEEQAYPFEEQAITIWRTNTDNLKAEWYDEWVKRTFSSLASIYPARYDKQERVEVVVDVSQ